MLVDKAFHRECEAVLEWWRECRPAFSSAAEWWEAMKGRVRYLARWWVARENADRRGHIRALSEDLQRVWVDQGSGVGGLEGRVAWLKGGVKAYYVSQVQHSGLRRKRTKGHPSSFFSQPGLGRAGFGWRGYRRNKVS